MSHRIIGTLTNTAGQGVVRMEDRFDTDLDDLWSAFTNVDRLGRWLGEVEGDLQLGGEFRARFFSSGWEGTGRIEVCEPPHRFVVSTAGSGSPDRHTIEAVLTADGDHTLLVLEERGINPTMLAGYGAGIQTHIEDLAAHLAGGERCDANQRFDELFPLYEALAR